MASKNVNDNVNLPLLKTEMRRIWGFPILELVVGFVALMSITSVSTLQEITTQVAVQSTLTRMVADAVYNTVNLQMLPLGLFCGILVALSFARDYEQGLMQTLLSAPLSRASVFIIKFVAVIVPLTLVSWGITMFTICINFYTSGVSVLLLLQVAAASLLAIFLFVLFYGGLATIISLTFKRTIPAALTAMILGFLMYFVTTLRTEAIGSLANYLAVTPFKAPLVGLGKLVGVVYANNTLENTLPTASFLAIALVYSLLLLIPMFLYFKRRFEIRE